MGNVGRWSYFGSTSYRFDVWKSAVAGLRSDGGIGHIEFINFDTGAAVLLACDGEWRTAGEFRVFYLAPSGVISEVSGLLWKMRCKFSTDPDHWGSVQTSCVTYLAALLDASPAHDIDVAES